MSKLHTAMFAVHAAGIVLKKDAAAVYGEYATLGNVLEKLRPVLIENGLYVEQMPDFSGPNPALRTRIVHAESGEYSEAHTPLILDKQTMQGVGSAITYARRYALVSAFGLDADDDDDGNAASGAQSAEAKVTRKRKAASPEPARKVL